MATKIYTRTGDEGETGLFGGVRVSKDHPRVEAYGAVDELNAALGWVRVAVHRAGVRDLLVAQQRVLFELGAALAAADERSSARERLREDDVLSVERAIDAAEATLPRLRSFVLPGGGELAARLHVARVVCRRAERRVVALHHQVAGAVLGVKYLNRLGDLLFVLARSANAEEGCADELWQPRDA